MSTIGAAAVAGATAARLPDASTNVAAILYGELKRQTAGIAAVNFSALEQSLSDQGALASLETAIAAAKLNDDKNLIDLASKLIESAVRQKIKIGNHWLVEIDTLSSGGNITFSDTTTDALLKSELVEAKGNFSVTNTATTRKNGRGLPFIHIGDFKGGDFSVVQKVFNQVPLWFKIGGTAVLVIMVGWSVLGYMQKRAAFDTAIAQMFAAHGDDYMSSVNMVLNLDGAVRSTRDAGFWNGLNHQWNTHVERIQSILAPVWAGLSDGSMVATGSADRICPGLKNVIRVNYGVLTAAKQVTGIGLNYSAPGNDNIIAMFGPSVTVPSTGVLEDVYSRACASDIEMLKNPPDTRTAEEKRQDKLKDIDQQLNELQALKATDIESATRDARDNFLSILVGYYAGQGMYRADAIAQAEKEYDDTLTGVGLNYEIPGMNDAVDQIRFVEQLKTRDLDAEINALEDQRAKVAAATT